MKRFQWSVLLLVFAVALAGSQGRLRDLPVGHSGFVGSWFLWAENPKLLCLDANADVELRATSPAMMRVEHRAEGFWIGLPEHFVLELGEESSKAKGECLVVEGFLR